MTFVSTDKKPTIGTWRSGYAVPVINERAVRAAAGLLFLETAFGICVGCSLQSKLSKAAPQHCPGGTCEVPTT